MFDSLKSEGIQFLGNYSSYKDVLDEEVLRFVASLQREFGPDRQALLAYRGERQSAFDNGELPDFLKGRYFEDEIRGSDWKVTQAPKDLEKRWVEITGPASNPKMVINALNSGADTYMADSEDSESPTLDNILNGQRNLKQAARKELAFTDKKSGKKYSLNDNLATLIFRPRGWHLEEAHMLVDNEPVSASLFDFGIHFFNNSKKLVENGSGPYFYLPKMENHFEAKLWNMVFKMSEEKVGMSNKIKATALIETLPAAFEMEEILFEMKDYIVGLNCGRWDYIFSYIKTLGNNPDFVLPDRSQITMDKGFLAAYAKKLIQTCHKRGAYAMGGMAAQIPVKGDERGDHAYKLFQAGAYDHIFEKYSDTWVAKVLGDKLREAELGHDGTWIAHPGLREIAYTAFHSKLEDKPHQLDKIPEGGITRDDLLRPVEGKITHSGMYMNIKVGIEYLGAWLSGNGCVPLNDSMEDAATVEIPRSQIWQQIRHGAIMDDGTKVTKGLFSDVLGKVKKDIITEIGPLRYSAGNYDKAARIFEDMSLAKKFPSFLTLPAYQQLMKTS